MLTKERKVGIEAVLKASEVCQKVFKTIVKNDTITKSDESPVTIGDFASQAVVSIILQENLPGFKMVGEEDSNTLQKSESVRNRVKELVNSVFEKEYTDSEIMTAIDCGTYEGGPNGSFWTIDPIDGTKGFIRGGQYAVCLSYIVNGEVQLGILGCPNLPVTGVDESEEKGCLFIGEKGKGSVQRNFNSEVEIPIHVSQVDTTENSRFCESFEVMHSSHDASANIAKQLNITFPPIRIDSQCKYGILSRGVAEIYLRFARPGYVENIWDHAPGSIIIKEAGGIVCDIYGKPLDFSVGRKLKNNVGVIATNGLLHEKVMEAVQNEFKINK